MIDDIFNYIKENNYISKHDKHEIYLIKVKKLINVKLWDKNRELDKSRMEEIKKSILNKTFVFGIIYIAYINSEWVCYDGQHRLFSFLELKNYKQKILVDMVYDDINEDDVKKYFININKSVSVPNLFLEENIDYKIKNDINKLVKKYNDKYKDFFSTSSNPRIPNTNRDRLSDDIYEIYLKFNHNIDNIENNLNKLNDYYKDNYNNDKCKKYDFYLFVKKNIDLDDYEKIL